MAVSHMSVLVQDMDWAMSHLEGHTDYVVADGFLLVPNEAQTSFGALYAKRRAHTADVCQLYCIVLQNFL